MMYLAPACGYIKIILYFCRSFEMRRLFIYLMMSVLVHLLAGCEDKGVTAALADVSGLIANGRSDSALILLDSLESGELRLDRHSRMLCRLYRQNAYNKLDTIFRSTDEAQALADYFDDNGTPNEQMLAYYLLGRAYYDLHEAPMALRYYQIAVERADTTADDCNYRQLSRVYGQMGYLFYYQNLMEKSLQCDDKSIEYGLKGKDTLNAILSMPSKSASFDMLSKKDSAIYIAEQASALAYLHGYEDISAAILGGIISDLVEKGELIKAKQYMNQYESGSGYFDKQGNIEKGRETYYYSKGLWYLYCNHLDSAEFFFRKELRDGKDFNNQNAGSRGLALLFQKTHKPDSAAKYALYSYAMNDSVYAQMATDKQMQALYDYSRHQEIAQQEQHRADKEHQRLLWIVFLLVLVVMISASLIRKEKRKRREVRDKYDSMVSTLAQMQTDVLMLRSHETELSQVIREKEKKIDKLNEAIFSYQNKTGKQKESSEGLLLESPDYSDLRVKAARGIVLSENDWQRIYVMIINSLPNFYKFITTKKFELNDKEFKTCILIRLRLSPGDIAKMLNVSPAYITKIRNSMMKKLFDVVGKSKELDAMLMEIS